MATAEWLKEAQEDVREVYVHDTVYMYIAQLARATRGREDIVMGLSPRGTIALTAMARAYAYLKGRDYVIPDDVADVFPCVAVHRIQLGARAKAGHARIEDILERILAEVKPPSMKRGQADKWEKG